MKTPNNTLPRTLLGSIVGIALTATIALAGPASAQTSTDVDQPTAPPQNRHDRNAPGLPAAKVAKILIKNEHLKAADAKFDALVGKADAGSYVKNGKLVVLQRPPLQPPRFASTGARPALLRTPRSV